MSQQPSRERAILSQESLARSIEREVQARLPASGSHADLALTVDASLREQIRHNELVLAYVRVASVTAMTLIAWAGHARPDAVGATAVSAGVVWLAAFWTLTAAALVLLLRRGWYRRWLRLLVPAVDALLIGLAVLFFPSSTGSGPDPAVPGIVALAAIACALLVFSGAIRLARSAQHFATALALGTWILIAIALDTPVLIGGFVAAALLVSSLLGERLASFVRSSVSTRITGDRLERLYRDARVAVEARQEVLQVVAHDLRNPLSTIGMTAELLRDTPLDAPTTAKLLATISRCSETMNRMIHDLLDVARMEAGRLHVELTTVPAGEVLQRVVELMRPIAEQSRLTLTSDGRADGIHLIGDRDRLQQVFSNLIGNAIKFTPAGGSIVLQAQRIGDRVRFAVLDTGPGVPPERAQHLFERFWQADAKDRRGLGLGLAIARSIVEAHDGRIGVERRPTGGSEFWFTIPVADEEGR